VIKNKNKGLREAYEPTEQEVKNLLAWVGVSFKDVEHLEVEPGRVRARTARFSYEFDLEDTWDPYLEYDFPWKLERKSLVQ
jgi:hypothetical protein